MTGGYILAQVGTSWFTKVKFLENEPWRWLLLLGTLLVSFVVGKIISFVLSRQSQRLERRGVMPVVAMLLKIISRPALLLVLAGGLYVASTFMNLTYVTYRQVDGETVAERKSLVDFWLNVCRTIAVIAVGWFIFRLVDLIEFYLRRWTSKTETQLDDQLVPLVRKSLRAFIVVVAGLFIARNIFRWDIGALIAGLGIGGLALALAANDMLANLFGSVTIFADRPFQMGDRIKVRDFDGFVEEVGFRSTRIRTFFGHVVTVPNSVIANEPVENVGRRPYIRRNLEITVTYDTPPEKMRRACQIVREMLESRAEHFPPDLPGWVHFMNFNAGTAPTLQRRGHRVRLPDPNALSQAGFALRGRRARQPRTAVVARGQQGLSPDNRPAVPVGDPHAKAPSAAAVDDLKQDRVYAFPALYLEPAPAAPARQKIFRAAHKLAVEPTLEGVICGDLQQQLARPLKAEFRVGIGVGIFFGPECRLEVHTG
jgi:MscS family membrane protein